MKFVKHLETAIAIIAILSGILILQPALEYESLQLITLRA